MIPESKLVVVWGNEDILRSSIEHFLGTKENWRVITLSNEEDLEALIQAVESSKPDIVIIHQGCHTGLNLLALQLLQAHPDIKVITISLENNLMEVYSKQKIMVKQASDLITVIEDEA